MLKQELYLKLQQKLSPQQIQLMKLVQLPTIAFEQRVKQELEENPALEEGADFGDEEFSSESDEWENDEFEQENTIDTSDINIDEYLSDDEIPNYKTYTNNYSDDDEDRSIPYAQGVSFIDFLESQLHTFRLDEEEFRIAEFIIGNLDDDGYLRRELQAVVDDLAFTQNIYSDRNEVEH